MAQITLQEWAKRVASHGREVAYRPGDPILFQGDEVTEIGLVTLGRAKATAYTDTGSETWLGAFEKGDLIGHSAFLLDCEINFEVRAETHLTALMLPIAFVRRRLEDESEVGRLFAVDLAKRLAVMLDRYVEALTLSAKGRVCAELLRLADPIGIEPSKLIVRPNPVFVEIAVRINSTRETVSRTINELQKQGIVSRTKGAMLIENPAALRSAKRG